MDGTKTPPGLEIRRVIFERFNDIEARFNNDEILDILRQGGDTDRTIDELEPYFEEICRQGLVRNIAQNLTTMWFKLFEPMRKIHCNACGLDVHLGGGEEICPNPGCKKAV